MERQQEEDHLRGGGELELEIATNVWNLDFYQVHMKQHS
jgi:hypothetical protein